MRRVLPLLTLFLALSCASASESPPLNDPPGSGGAGGNASVPPLEPATGIAINEVAIYQGVKVPLYAASKDEILERNAPIIQGRDALLRVFFALKEDWDPHQIKVRLTLQQGSDEPQTMEIQGTPKQTTSDAELNTSANFDIPAAMLDGTLSIKAELLNVEAGQEGDTSGSFWPTEGLHKLEEQSTHGPFRVKVFPIRYDADKSGRVPDLSEEQQKEIRYAFLKTYPISSVQMEIGEEIPWSSAVSANGNGWQKLLQHLNKLRKADPTPDIYYYGLFLPSTSMATFCTQGCVAGLTLLSPSYDDPSLRASIGLGFPGSQALTTMLHEIGHAHQRIHAPCGPFGQLPDQIDPSFPYKDGKIGVWGYDLIDKKLKDPSKFGDTMSYCEPTWISDYTFQALFDRNISLTPSALMIGKPSRWREAWLDVNHELRWGEVVELNRPPSGEELDVVLGTGIHARKVKGYFNGMSHLPGGLLLLPEKTELSEKLDAGHQGRFSTTPSRQLFGRACGA